MKARIMSFVVAASLATFPAVAQNAKPLKTKKNTSIALVNLLNPKPDCSANVALPTAGSIDELGHQALKPQNAGMSE